MAYALVNTVPVQLNTGSWEGENPAVWVPKTITASVGTICNLISYDGISVYTPPEGYRLLEVPEDAKVGDTGY